jgi:plastocyanin
MATQVQFRRGTTAQTSTFTGATAEITIDTDKEVVVVHDGVTAGGYPLARESALTANVASITGAFNTANAAFTTANSAGSYANSAFLVANSAASYSNTVNNTQNNSITAAFASANSAGAYANSAFIHANAAFVFANTISGGAAIDNVARSLANTAEQTAITAGSYANSAFLVANSTAAYSNTVNNTQNNSITAAFTAANSSGVYANGAFTRANNSLNANTGGTVVGDVSITGNLTVSGLTTYTNTTTLLVADNIITVNAAINQSAQPTVNAGIEVDRGAQPNTSILWIETLGKWTANNGNGTITLAADSAESYANAAFLAANAATATDDTQNNSITAAFTAANSAGVYANGAFVQANSNYISAATRLTVTNNGSSAYLIDQYTGNNATIYVSGGETIAFHLNGISGHPFMIRVSSGGANYDTGLTHVANNGTVTTQSSAQGQVAGTLYWKVPFDIVGSTYVYQCSVHAGMVGNIVIQQPASFVAANTTLALNTANAAFLAANSAAGDGLAFAIALG